MTALPELTLRQRADYEDVQGNVLVANGLHGKARQAYRRADSLRRKADAENEPFDALDSSNIETKSSDLHRSGDPQCDHQFSAWETISGVVERDGKTVGELYFEANCHHCDARVGRKIEMVVTEQTA